MSSPHPITPHFPPRRPQLAADVPAPDQHLEAARAEWLRERQSGIGASEAAAVLGCSPWKTPLHVYAEKVGLATDSDSTPKAIGRFLESGVADLYAHVTGRKPLIPAVAIHRHPHAPWLFCTPDRFVVDATDSSLLIPLEIKTSTTWEGWGETGTSDIPTHYAIQVHHQMMVLGVPRAEVAVLIAGCDLRTYTLHASLDLGTDLFERLTHFWFDHVVARVPPPPDWLCHGTAELVATMTRPTTVAAIALDDPAAAQWAGLYLSALRRANEAETDKAEARARLCLLMGSHERAVLPDGTRITRKEVTVRAHQVKERRQVSFRLTPLQAGGASGAGAGHHNPADIHEQPEQHE